MHAYKDENQQLVLKLNELKSINQLMVDDRDRFSKGNSPGFSLRDELMGIEDSSRDVFTFKNQDSLKFRGALKISKASDVKIKPKSQKRGHMLDKRTSVQVTPMKKLEQSALSVQGAGDMTIEETKNKVICSCGIF